MHCELPQSLADYFYLCRPSLSRFDYSHEDFPALAGNPTITSKRPPGVWCCVWGGGCRCLSFIGGENNLRMRQTLRVADGAVVKFLW